ncbi:MAG: hypothetical protein KF754_06385 [Planctomycetes bacterium]|nr:hypothetical protein [Planctomycetota bacterium]
MTNGIFWLIGRYLADCREVNRKLRAHFAVVSVVQAARSGKVPISAEIGDVSYTVHGIGCRALFGSTAVDFDIDASGDVGGFDAWRLHRYATANKISEWGSFSVEEIQRQLEVLLLEGTIVKASHSETSHLFVLTS